MTSTCLEPLINTCQIKDKTPEISCISCKRTKTSISTKRKFDELMKAYEEEQKTKKEQKEEEAKKQKELRKLQKKENPSIENSSNPSRPLTKRQVERQLKIQAKSLASKEESPEKITPEDPIAHKDNDGKLRISGTCPICKHKVNSFISKNSLDSDVLDYLKVDLTEKPKKKSKKEVSSENSEEETVKKQKKSKKSKKVELPPDYREIEE